MSSVWFTVNFFTDAGCMFGNGQVQLDFTAPVTTGVWTLASADSRSASFGPSVFAKFHLRFGCDTLCANGTTVNFDDVALQTEPLAVTVASLAARHVANGILLRWRTGTEADLLGFQVYRSHGGSWQRLTLIAANGSVSGASYRFLDKSAKRGVPYRYRIKVVNRDGAASWFGPVRAT